ncbi:hypothetical protein DL767_001158 [Monosporascus sp. MG133]|nr:hypothetical protein DL767_001158 [Monosporascus sp. MG133]
MHANLPKLRAHSKLARKQLACDTRRIREINRDCIRFSYQQHRFSRFEFSSHINVTAAKQAETKGKLQPPELGSVLSFPRKNRWSTIRPESALRNLSSSSTVTVAPSRSSIPSLASGPPGPLGQAALDGEKGGKRAARAAEAKAKEKAESTKDEETAVPEPTVPSYEGNSSRVTLANSEKSIETAFAFFLSTTPLLSPRLSYHPCTLPPTKRPRGSCSYQGRSLYSASLARTADLHLTASVNFQGACSFGIVAMFHWNLATLTQAFGRLHHLGQVKAVEWRVLKVVHSFYDIQESRMCRMFADDLLASERIPAYIDCRPLRLMIAFEIIKTLMGQSFNWYGWLLREGAAKPPGLFGAPSPDYLHGYARAVQRIRKVHESPVESTKRHTLQS